MKDSGNAEDGKAGMKMKFGSARIWPHKLLHENSPAIHGGQMFENAPRPVRDGRKPLSSLPDFDFLVHKIPELKLWAIF